MSGKSKRLKVEIKRRLHHDDRQVTLDMCLAEMDKYIKKKTLRKMYLKPLEDGFVVKNRYFQFKKKMYKYNMMKHLFVLGSDPRSIIIVDRFENLNHISLIRFANPIEMKEVHDTIQQSRRQSEDPREIKPGISTETEYDQFIIEPNFRDNSDYQIDEVKEVVVAPNERSAAPGEASEDDEPYKDMFKNDDNNRYGSIFQDNSNHKDEVDQQENDKNDDNTDYGMVFNDMNEVDRPKKHLKNDDNNDYGMVFQDDFNHMKEVDHQLDTSKDQPNKYSRRTSSINLNQRIDNIFHSRLSGLFTADNNKDEELNDMINGGGAYMFSGKSVSMTDIYAQCESDDDDR